MRKFLLGSVLAVLPLMGVAHAQSVGSVTGITGEFGEVIVQRGTETYSLSEGDEIFEGDKVTTRAGGTVEITANGCVVSLPSAATATVNTAFCTTPPTTLAEAPVTDPVVAAGGAGGANTGLLIGGGVLVGGGLIAAAAGGGDDDDTPASP